MPWRKLPNGERKPGLPKNLSQGNITIDLIIGFFQYVADTELLFPMRVAPSLSALRGSIWSDLVCEVCRVDAVPVEQVAFVILMVRLNGCITCNADLFGPCVAVRRCPVSWSNAIVVKMAGCGAVSDRPPGCKRIFVKKYCRPRPNCRRQTNKTGKIMVSIQPTKELVLAALKNVQDPELHKDLVTLNMVEDVQVNGNTVALKLS